MSVAFRLQMGYQYIHDTLFGPSYNGPRLDTISDYCLSVVFKYLTIRDLARCRQVCRAVKKSVDSYMDAHLSVTYDCTMNGIVNNRPYQFNMDAFMFILKQMPNLQIIKFEQCQLMKLIVANCQPVLITNITRQLYQLKQLHIGRSMALNADTITELRYAFPDLTHLTVSIFNEQLLEHIIQSFPRLQYLNLDHSILYRYSAILKKLESNIKTLILPPDLDNGKFSLIDALSKGNGRKLSRVEFRITIQDIEDDANFFKFIGKNLRHLRWFQCEMACKNKITTQSPEPLERSDMNYDLDFEWRRPIFSQNADCQMHYEHRHISLIRGLSQLKYLRVLNLKEVDYYDSEIRCSLFDDKSLLEIFRSCSRLEMITLSCALPRSKRNYKPYPFDDRQHNIEINQILNRLRRTTFHMMGSKARSRVSSMSANSDLNDNLLGVIFESDAESDAESVDSGISDIQQPHRISEHSLAKIDIYLPRLTILQLRGVRVGVAFFEAIANLPKLQYVRLDSISFNTGEYQQCLKFLSTKRLAKSGVLTHITNTPF